MITRGVFRLQIQRGSDIVPQVLAAYSMNDTLHTLEMKVKFEVEQGHDGRLRRELVGCYWEEFGIKHMEGNLESPTSYACAKHQLLPSWKIHFPHIHSNWFSLFAFLIHSQRLLCVVFVQVLMKRSSAPSITL